MNSCISYMHGWTVSALLYTHDPSYVVASHISEVFDNYMQQDAHEFLNFLLNTIADLLQSKYAFIYICNRKKDYYLALVMIEKN